jgi:hypothetical protein
LEVFSGHQACEWKIKENPPSIDDFPAFQLHPFIFGDSPLPYGLPLSSLMTPMGISGLPAVSRSAEIGISTLGVWWLQSAGVRVLYVAKVFTIKLDDFGKFWMLLMLLIG